VAHAGPVESGGDQVSGAMSDTERIHSLPAGDPIAFGERFAGSETFKSLFREGMALVEETATYLDGEGRSQSRNLPRAASLAYATESMRLTTRLMQLASWLLLQRAVSEGEMTLEQARSEKSKVRIKGFDSATDGPAWESLPEGLRALIERSIRLQERILKLDVAIYRAPAPPAVDNPVGRQLGRLSEAFETRK
jgi:regulator of CtrA degradation